MKEKNHWMMRDKRLNKKASLETAKKLLSEKEEGARST